LIFKIDKLIDGLFSGGTINPIDIKFQAGIFGGTFIVKANSRRSSVNHNYFDHAALITPKSNTALKI